MDALETERLKVKQLREALACALFVAEREATVAHASPRVFADLNGLRAVLVATAPLEEE